MKTEHGEVAEIAREAGVGMLILSHLTQACYPTFP